LLYPFFLLYNVNNKIIKMADMDKKNIERKIFIVSGSSGVGKNTIIDCLLVRNSDFMLLKSYTSRPKEERDEKNKNYFNITREDFEEKIANDKLLEYDIMHGNYMGIGKDIIEDAIKSGKSLIKDVSVLGFVNSKEKLRGKLGVVGIWLTADKTELKKRLENRGEKDIDLRLKIYTKEQKQMYIFDYIIDNYNKDKTIETMEKIFDIEHNNRRGIPYLSINRFSYRKIHRYDNSLSKGKRLKPVKVIFEEGEMFVVDGIYRYLASLINNVDICKIVIDKNLNLENKKGLYKEWSKKFREIIG